MMYNQFGQNKIFTFNFFDLFKYKRLRGGLNLFMKGLATLYKKKFVDIGQKIMGGLGTP